MVILTTALAVLLTGSLVYCVLVVAASRRFLSATVPAPGSKPPVSVLKPLCGHDDGLEENLRSFFVQDYPEYEVIFGVHRQDDPAVAVAEKVISEFSGRISARLIVTGESPIPNAKAFSLNRMVREARYDMLVMSDSDVRVTPSLLSHLSQEFQNEHIGLISCPYRAVPGESLWSRLEAIGMNTELLGGVLVARMIEGMRFALGCTVAVRRNVLEDMGGFGYLQEFLAEDFVIGQRAAELGHGVLLSSYVIEHRIGSQGMARNLVHRMRWARSTRRSRPVGYWGQIFTYPLPVSLLLWASYPSAWPFVVLTLILRGGAALATARSVVHDPVTQKQWWLLPVQDVIGFFIWISGFVGDKIVWRDRKCTVLRDGRLHVNP
ncbi:MAG TPA: bacteriohopanetetrol glucosamine biosynthesis glycosyltransferase HpnI [Candidatus Dormibacteraeota bacterium]|nr:bacteriohopanetetrol glucosamine biosynthesis glycosyltransferase HpnI [Candidatus Dormibacteraeota bacterium]